MDLEMDVQDMLVQSAAELLDIVRDGGELIVDNSEVAKSLVECGFEITKSSEGDDGTKVVLQVREENHDDASEVATSHPLPAQGTLELSEDRDPASFKKGPVTQYVAHPIPILGTPFRSSSPNSVDTESCKRYVQRSPGDKVDQEVYALLCLSPAYLRSTNATTQEVTLMLEEVVFGVENCVKEVHCLGHFVHRVDIKVCPSDAWKSSCTDIGTVRPGNNAPHPVQHTRSKGWEASVSTQGPILGGQ
ncbi:hypothetical protein KC19_9G089000 [Ceratodon purpureus]|uniref:Uncharacterized protein n=1 Tax=Ceratodon purpureus TaxID=3225 RepID=A0A8T0GS53_CERPU|nr:hypothetical protein KC19_9G089000 [Ceratodon purpureus]